MSTSWEYSQKKRSRQTKVAGDHLVFMSARIRQDLSVMDYNQTRQEKIIGIKINLNKALLVSWPSPQTSYQEQPVRASAALDLIPEKCRTDHIDR